jgi:hypothetical protein
MLWSDPETLRVDSPEHDPYPDDDSGVLHYNNPRVFGLEIGPQRFGFGAF